MADFVSGIFPHFAYNNIVLVKFFYTFAEFVKEFIRKFICNIKTIAISTAVEPLFCDSIFACNIFYEAFVVFIGFGENVVAASFAVVPVMPKSSCITCMAA